MKTSLVIIVFFVFVVGVGSTFTTLHASSEELNPSGKDYVPYTENYNVSFNHDGKIDYDLLIAKIMPEIFENKLRTQGVNISQGDVVLNRGPQPAIYQEYSYNCGYD